MDGKYAYGEKVTSLVEIMGRPAYVRVLLLLRKQGPLRFTEIQKILELNPKTIDGALKDLRRGLWIVPMTGEEAPGGRILVQYDLSKRGHALIELLDGVHEAARRRQRTLGSDAVKELDALFA
jgi:DNA-binding HxlR family transcriptional regulator